MIQPPKRSVTRFFIPLIDVLILLFCIFLLMPYVKPGDEDLASTKPGEEQTVESLRGDLERARRERDRMAKDRDRAIRQQQVCVLEIDRDTGRLFQRAAVRVEIADQAAAAALMDRERRAAPGREVYFLIQYPRELSGYPVERQVTAYERWFAGVPYGFDNPRGRRPGVPR